MRHFATDSDKSKGQFYTPAEVSRIVTKVVGISKDTPQDATVYDPACGSGSLLLKASDEAPCGLTIFGQEMDNATSALARMNMILHDNVTAKIWQDNTLANPQWKNTDGSLKTFDFAVANPPFSVKSWSNGINLTDDEFKRFEYGTPPDKNGDYAFLLHILKSLKSTGKGAVILPHGVLFRGNAEARIRTNLIKQGYIKGIIGLPTNLFYGTGIPACIIVLDKADSATRQEIFMIDASKGYMKDGNKNRLRSQDIHKLVDVFTKQIELERYSRIVPLSEIAANDYNLNIPRYIDSSEAEDLHVGDDFEFSVYVSLTLIKPKRELLSSYYLMHLLNSEPYKNRAKEQVYMGGGVGNLNVDVVRNYPIVVPPQKEQTAIANVLSTMDTELDALQQRLAKTQHIKQGMMQELLTGKTRLI